MKIKLLYLLLIITLQNCFAINAAYVNARYRLTADLPPRGRITDRDPRHFQNTPVWEMAKAIFFYENGKLGELLKKNKELVNYQKDSRTLLGLAVFYKREGAIKILLNHKADPNIGFPVLLTATYEEDDDIIEILLQNGADPNVGLTNELCVNNDKNTPLTAAAGQGSMYRVQLLLKYCANPNSCYGRAMEHAIHRNNYDIAYYLLESGGYDPKTPTLPYSKYWDIRRELRDKTHPLRSDLHREKMKFVKLLKEKGLDYFKYPTERALYAQKTYPDNWMEYLENY